MVLLPKMMNSDIHEITIKFTTQGNKKILDKVLVKIIKLLQKVGINQINCDFNSYLDFSNDLNKNEEE